MGVFEMVVFVVLIGSGASVLQEYFKAMGRRAGGADRQAFQAEMAALRKEMAELRTWASDLVLSFDSTLNQQGARLESLERRALGEGTPAARLGAAAETAPGTIEVRPQIY